MCFYLNNAIKKYGAENFTVTLLHNCRIEDSDKIETEEIFKHNSLYPNGYNLNTGGKSSKHTEESKQRVSNGVVKYFQDKKLKRFENVEFYDSEENFEKYLKPLNRDGVQYGWYVLIKKMKADFGGSCIPLEKSKKMALDFMLKIKENSMAKRLVVPEPP